MANSTPKPNAPLAGRPPFATDEPDSIYDDSQSAPRRRQRQPKSEDNRSASTYDVYDNYLDEKSTRQSGYGDVGMGFLTGDMDDDDSDDETLACHADPMAKKSFSDEKLPPAPQLSMFPAVPIVAPKPGYAAPVSALTMPEPTLSPVGQQRTEMLMPTAHPHPNPQMAQRMPVPGPLAIPNAYGRGPASPISVPSTPHPLQPPMTPITPAFARPPKKAEDPATAVKFSDKAILRGTKEETLLPKRGEKGDDFWRRFSMVAKDERTKRTKVSSWLEKTQTGAARLSRWLWVVGVLILLLIGGAIGLGWYVSHNSTASTAPKALGGSAGEGASFTPTTSKTVASTGAGALGGATSSVRHVSPTNTVAKRLAMPFPTPVAGFSGVGGGLLKGVQHAVPLGSSSAKRRRMAKRFA